MLLQDLQGIGLLMVEAVLHEQRMQMELYYIDNLSLKMDIKVFFKTIEAVIKREGAI